MTSRGEVSKEKVTAASMLGVHLIVRNTKTWSNASSSFTKSSHQMIIPPELTTVVELEIRQVAVMLARVLAARPTRITAGTSQGGGTSQGAGGGTDSGTDAGGDNVSL